MLSKKRKIIKRRNSRNKLFLILITILFFLIIAFLAFSNLRMSRRRGETAERIEELKREIQILEERNEQLKAGIFEVETDAYWQAKLYEQGFKKSGEEAIVIIPPKEEGKEINLLEETEEISFFSIFTFLGKSVKSFFENLLD